MTTLSPEARKFSQEEIDKAEETLLRAAIKNADQDCFNSCRVLFDHGAQLSSTIDSLTAEVERLRESVGEGSDGHPGDDRSASAARGTTASRPKKGRLRVTFDFDLRRMTRKESGDDTPVPTLDEYTPRELGEFLAYALECADYDGEMYAGSMVFVRIKDIKVVSAQWDGAGGDPRPLADPSPAQRDDPWESLSASAAQYDAKEPT